ncbi:MAG: UDP-N-acetylmuramoyl-tripeptide--D-alanyl-D-alanine ligase [Oscillospiraceae bacterium]|nr:UDP-N-acetylmuramoyl-tripeptide--D-alanyl-D-alanine ligase [Oscillospiraceae bacterium]
MSFFILSAAFMVSALTASLACVHMLQLSSYQTPSYLAWIKRGAGDYYTKQWPAAGIAMLGLWESEYSTYAAAAVFIVMGLLNLPKKAKKPLKYTPRVIRLLIVQLLLIAMAAAAALPLRENNRLALVCLAAAYMLTPFITVLSNFITVPLQRLINRSFINDAKRILHSMPDLKIIGITGSYGKTSMKFILTRLLSVKYETLQTPESYNTPMGVVRTIRERLKPTHEFFVCEMGARHVGDIREICEIVNPRYGILTAIGEQHLDTFKTLDNIISTKFELIDSITDTAFLNIDSAPVREHARPANCVTYALDSDANYTISGLSVSSKGSSFSVRAPDGESAEFCSPLLGRHSVLNILGAVAAAHTLGVPLARLAEPVSRLPQVKHRLELIKGGRFTIIDDAFNANPAGVKAALDTLGMFEGFKAVITPGMVELGEMQDELNRVYGTQLAGVCDHVILVGKRQTEPIAKGLREAGYSAFTVTEKFEDAMNRAAELNADIVLLANDLPDNY